MEGLDDDFPVNWYVDTQDYSARECQGLQILVDTTITDRTDAEMEGEHDWVKRKMLLFMVS